MQISWHGLGAFSITGKPVAGDVTLITDPFDNSVGLRLPKTLTAAVVTSSIDSEVANNFGVISGTEEKKKPFLVNHAGEFEVQGVFVTGINAPLKDKTPHTIYRYDLEGVSIANLGAMNRRLLEKEVAALGNIDVLIVPVGGESVYDEEAASEAVNQIEPRLVIPSYYNVPGLKINLKDVELFCKELACVREDSNKLKITKAGLPQDEVEVAVIGRT